MDKNSVKPLEGLLDSVRDIDGFPIGKDEDILALSDPPFYTACPNPYIKQFIEEYGKPYDQKNDDYKKTPFVEDVSEGKGNPIYNVHTYHTKVPHKAIMKFIEHYTELGDIIFDGFCGSGMTGVAAQLTNRKAILSDLSPIATLIAYNYNIPNKLTQFQKEAIKILKQMNEEIDWMYQTNHTIPSGLNNIDSYQKGNTHYKNVGKINYTVWTDVIICPFCGNDFKSYQGSISDNSILEKNRICPSCNAEIKNNCERAKVTFYDSVLDREVQHSKQVPIVIDYSYQNKQFKKFLDKDDLDLISKIEQREIPYCFPIARIPEGHNTNQPINSHNFKFIHHLYTKRNLWSASFIYDKIIKCKEKQIKNLLLFWFTSLCIGQTKLNRYFEESYSQVNRYLKGTLYVGKKITEVNPNYSHKGKIKIIAKNLDYKKTKVIIGTNSSTNLPIGDNTIDYIFTDPPFGGNIMYSELNIIWESWLKVMTNNEDEAIINDYQSKKLEEYSDLMTKSFEEFYRILKPNRWITVVFHNSKAAVWNSIQQSMTKAGFVIAQVTTMDKQQETFKQMTAPGSAKNDLIINAYKPKEEFSERFLKNAGEGMEVDFVTQQLEHLPVQPNIERTEKMLYSKMLAHYVENGFKIKYNSTDFYKLLSDNFVELDGYWVLDSQVKDYNEWKSGLSLDQIKEVLGGQQVLFVSDEKSAITWMYNFLHTPKDFNEIYTAYQQVATITEDAVPEPREIFDSNFILENGKYRRPISREEKEEINKNRERELDHAFNKLLRRTKEQKGKIRNIRQEALVHGFTRCYQEGKYQDILTVADKLYASTLEASGDIMDFVDIARIKTSGNKEDGGLLGGK